MKIIKNLIKDEDGQGLIEYTLLFALIAIVSLSTMEAANGSLKNGWSTIKESLIGIASKF